MMGNKEWESLYHLLLGVYVRFMADYRLSENGRNKQIRGAASRRAVLDTELACYHIRGNLEAYNLLTGDEGTEYYGRRILFEEFSKPFYFKNDMRVFLEQMRRKINETGKDGDI